MAANTIMMCLRFSPSYINDRGFLASAKKVGELIFASLSSESSQLDIQQDKMYIFTSTSGSHATLRTYANGLVTLDVQHYGEGVEYEWNFGKYNMEVIKELKKKIEDHFGSTLKGANSLCAPIRRGGEVWPYFVTADERLLETDYDKVVCETNSACQNIKVMHSREFGKVLVLDDDISIGESDLIYAQRLLGLEDPKRENYEGKEILILGGGDGGLLHELLKENPKFITMAEVDEEVIKISRVHLRSICGDSLDKLEGSNYKIIIGDGIKLMKDSLKQGKKYDYIVNDISEFAVDFDKDGFAFDFNVTHQIMEVGLELLKSRGKMLARGDCASWTGYYALLKEDVTKLGAQLKRRSAYVPSFHETYCFDEIWRD